MRAVTVTALLAAQTTVPIRSNKGEFAVAFVVVGDIFHAVVAGESITAVC
jgi:hypothetical protein